MIYIDNRQNKIKAQEDLDKLINEIIDYALKKEEVDIGYEISVIYVDNEIIKEINNDTRGINKETDVLSFPMLEYPKGRVFSESYREYSFGVEYLNEGNLVLGDIVLSLEKALEQSKEYNHSFLREVCYLVVHSVLHLLGYDHIDEEEKVIMRKKEEEILESFNISRG
ncbi:endoribonuclease YbeY [Clostridium tetani]|uniref:Endoribonuclease YbeY n=1 Tax=Clostridium tetani (strain Massachusetts / E88) TaxID=212717 RepID=YBEY_CLOTE|nr:rRNA maturation RNase YbeY [Clostridium tetani]Q892R9.1 RecName: Full=Endoribonuclease YbeY [Clostridium tetani E88]AAO36525.1 metal-binding protein [Clostridium tetani E88]KGI39007.1 heat-shock protein [Clostridium tetani]KGI43576.1 heat-shock protein [Clostridium tetani]KHO31442.1 heat-shock protein [Clostridium tetani]KIG20765.1 heat-shock protein [Clostridium tetani]